MEPIIIVFICMFLIYWTWVILSFVLTSLYYKRRNSRLSSILKDGKKPSFHPDHTDSEDKCVELSSRGSDYTRLESCTDDEVIVEDSVWVDLVDIHFWVTFCASCCGFWWSKIPMYPRKTVFFIRSLYITLGTMLILAGALLMATNQLSFGYDKNPDDRNGMTIIVPGVFGIIFWVCQVYAWRGYDSIGSLFHRPSPIRFPSYFRRMQKRMTFFLVFGSVMVIIVPGVIGYTDLK
jgi:hypothetical protein